MTKIIFSQAYKKHKMKFFAPKHSRYIEVSTPTIIFLISCNFTDKFERGKVGIIQKMFEFNPLPSI